MRTLYFDCFSGASGNMILAGLIEVGVDRDALAAEIDKLGLSGVELALTKVDRSGIASTHVEVKYPHEHVHRHLSDITKIINDSALSDAVKRRAVAVFTRLAEAEARVHGVGVEKIHFHEVGALDAIVDIVGACIGFEMLGIERFAASKIHVGSGFVEMAHGKFPVPPPAVAELLKSVPIYSTEIVGELTTPTGAAIISTVCDSYGIIPEMIVECTGYGAGGREYDKFPNVIRLLLGETAAEQPTANRESLTLIETNIDDLSPQILGFAMERAFELGALDCWFTPIQMKKSRPATMVSVLCDDAKAEAIKAMLYSETTTLGVRLRRIERECIEREIVNVSTKFGEIAVKVASSNGNVVNVLPEYDDVRAAALTAKAPFTEVRDEALAAFKRVNTAEFEKAVGN